MTLAQYSDQFWLTSGTLATGVPAYVFPRNSNSLASLYADSAGTIPLANPITIDGTGFVTFYAAVGEYWISVGGESFFINVGMSYEQSDLSTGVATGGELDVAGAQSITIHPLVGYIIDNTSTSPNAPPVTLIDFPGATVSLTGASLTRTFTWWLLDANQNVIQQGTRPDAAQRRSQIVLGASVFDTVALTLLEVQTLPVILAQPINQLVALMDALGPFSLSGNRITPNGVNLSINKSAGVVFSRAFNMFVNGMLTDNPHVSTSPAQTPVTLRRILRTASVLTPAGNTTLDPANYDLNGVLTPVGGGTHSSTIQRVWLFAVNTTALQIVVQYGQSVYTSLAAATAAIGAGTFTPAVITADAALIGYIAIIRSATNLSDPTQATFVTPGKFATP